MIANEIKTYILKEYKKLDLKIIPGHYPKIATKENVDNQLQLFRLIEATILEDRRKRE